MYHHALSLLVQAKPPPPKPYVPDTAETTRYVPSEPYAHLETTDFPAYVNRLAEVFVFSKRKRG